MKNKKEIETIPIVVPKGVRYIGDWEEFTLPEEPTIIDKKLPGCGFTEWCLFTGKEDLEKNGKITRKNINNKNVILCSPRKILLFNKHEQHPDTTFLVINTLGNSFDDSVDKDLLQENGGSKKAEKKYTEKELKELKEKTVALKTKIENYAWMCHLNGEPAKILVTYDSYRLVKEALTNCGLFEDFYTVIDEFQSIFIDSSFKSDIEMEFVNELSGVKRVSYVSATPMIDKYLKRLDDFKNLPYYELDWVSEDPYRIVKPILDVKSFNSVNMIAKKIIDSYLVEDYKTLPLLDENGNVKEVIESKEAVFYVNSVKNIIGIINKCGLTPDQVNILCADTENNKAKIKNKLGKDFSIGKVPLKNEPNKMFTFCTRTVYLGADFYSKCARTFIISDANLKTLKVDISLDLPQILGRQRDDDNPWHNRAEFYYKTTYDFRKVPQEVFEKEINEKIEKTRKLLNIYETTSPEDKKELVEVYEDRAKMMNYSKDYVGINKHKGKFPIPVENKLVYLSELRAFEIQQKDYADRFSVFASINSVFGDDSIVKIDKNTSIILEDINELKSTSEKIKYLNEHKDILSSDELNYVISRMDEKVVNYITILGFDGCKACGYNITSMNDRCKKERFNKDVLKNEIYKFFKEGDKISLSKLKTQLKEIYTSLSYKSTPKAKDIEDYFVVKTISTYEKDPDTNKLKKINGYELISKKF